MSGRKIEAYGLSDIGPVRPNNEDVWISIRKYSFFALADGMGGHNAGEVAAKEAIQCLSNAIREITTFDKKSLSSKQFILFLKTAIENANQRVFQLGKEHSSLQGMGTTLCCLYFYGDDAIYAHVGDSRIYRYRNAELKQLTQDHSLLYELISSGQIDAPYSLPCKNIITRAIGTSPKVLPEIASATAQQNDIFFMCTDGLTDFVSEQEMEEILKASLPLKKTVKTLIERAKEKGSHDNITILMIKIKQ